MPGASEVAMDLYLRLFLLGPPKIGKTRAAVTTCEPGVLLINCDEKGAIRPAVLAWKRKDGQLGAIAGDEFDVELVEELNDMERALAVARKGVKAGLYHTIVVDPLSSFASNIEVQLADATNESGKGPDGRRYWPEYTKRLQNVCARLFRMKAHVIVTSHYMDVGGEIIEGQTAKSGHGIVPLLGGKARTVIPAMFQDVVFMDMRNGQRVFVTSGEGVWGPGCRSLPSGAQTVPIPANIRMLMKAMGIRKIGNRVKKNPPVEAAPGRSNGLETKSDST
jgi:hypothetical protein